MAPSSTSFWISLTVTRPGPNLRQALAQVLGRGDCFLPGTSIRENNTRFSIRPQTGEDVVGIKVDGCLLGGQSGLACDAAFFVHIKAEKRLVIALVELKGGEVDHAFEQVLAVRDFFAGLVGCAKTSQHGKPLIDALGDDSPISHGARLLGVVVSKRGIPQPDRLKVLAHRRGVKIVIKPDATGITCSDLIEWQSA